MKKKLLSGIALSLVTSSMLFGGPIGAAQSVEPEIELPEPSELVENGVSQRPVNLGLKVGTLGVGLDISTPIDDKFALRFNVNGATYNRVETEQEIEYDADFKFANAGLLVDYFPYEDLGFHLSAGAYYNGNEVDAKAKQANNYEINGITYTSAEVGSLDGQVDFNKFAPYLGLGWGNDSRSEGFNFAIDLGILVGKPKLELTATRGTNVTDAVWAEIQNNVTAEKEKVDDDLDKLKIYPVLMVGVTYTF